jgi:type II secretory pathway component PulF
LGDQSLPEILRFAERTYRQQAERRVASWRILLPATIGALLGGFVVLVYALGLFGPFTQLLQDLVY